MEISRHRKVLSFYQKHKRMPSVTEIMSTFGLSSRSSGFYVMQQLVKEGIAEKDRTGKLVPGPDLFTLPVLGRIRAGFAAPAEEEIADTITIGEYLLGRPEASYLLKVEGDSMIDAGIQEGDMVVFERTNDYKPGDIVVALTEDGYTLKYLRRKDGKYYLEAANENYPDIHPREGEIIGVVVSTFRTYA
ncbi:MAG TPA: transcriptional repressor LexA [Candidatus Paceibacterota bacterium]|jgi:repressor LexA|nr:transcriptional repressor LexA [Candidatus Paceibacterota bacterium]